MSSTDLSQFLESQRKQIVDYIEGRYIPNDITSNPTFNEIAKEIEMKFPLNHGARDQAHNVLAMAVVPSMWCGWLSQAKTNRGVYSQEYIDGFNKAITDAFQIGRTYSKDRP